VWLDLDNEKVALPKVEDQIIVKALRLSWHEPGEVRRAHSEHIEESSEPMAARPAELAKQGSDVHNDLADIFGAADSNSSIPDLL
jgi:hypothetical protein